MRITLRKVKVKLLFVDDLILREPKISKNVLISTSKREKKINLTLKKNLWYKNKINQNKTKNLSYSQEILKENDKLRKNTYLSNNQAFSC